MSHSKNASRRKSVLGPAVEGLETRQVLTGGAGSTFAIVQGTVETSNQKVNVPFSVASTEFTAPKGGKLIIGIDVAPQTKSSVVPKVVGIVDETSKASIPVARTTYSKEVRAANTTLSPQTTAVVATLRNVGVGVHKYDATVVGDKASTGSFLLGFYLPGDANGDGTVDKADLAKIKSDFGAGPKSANYDFAVDSNRDGKINMADYTIAKKNLGAKTIVSPVVSANLTPATDSGLQDRVTNIKTVLFDGVGTPGASITYVEENGKAATATTTVNAAGNYAIPLTLGDGSNTFQVTSTDGFGQKIQGLIAPVTYSVNAAPAV